jgi:membrane protease YdiL (CAAX protease family)
VSRTPLPPDLAPLLAWGAGLLAEVLVGGALQAWKLFPADRPASGVWLGLWAVVLSLPIRLAAAVMLVKALTGMQPEQMGLTWRRAGRNALLGAALALPLALLVYGVNLGVEALLRPFSCGASQDHPLTHLARQGPTASQWFVLIAVAVAAAPVWEELLFRGLVQPWAIARPWAPALLVWLAVCLAVLLRIDSLRAAWSGGWFGLFAELVPALAALCMVPIYLALRHDFESPVPAGVFAAAALFGFFHARVWPSPIALTVLGAGLGWLAWRTRSLAGPIALHAVFNLIAVVVLLLELRA